MSRRTWKDRPAKSVGFTIDCTTASGGSRVQVKNDPFNAKGSKPAGVAAEIVRTLAILYGVENIEIACAAGLSDARKQLAKNAARVSADRDGGG